MNLHPAFIFIIFSFKDLTLRSRYIQERDEISLTFTFDSSYVILIPNTFFVLSNLMSRSLGIKVRTPEPGCIFQNVLYV